ncbi:protein regulator of cytokinesis 1-like isoform X2 [Belonocnema kinseyi]|uniref:protein regulator of cytokinesis 1-like isoform X2 n=1 Tax=Belonocnema kinseyi TaxID=2817044 RepID=UPI00143DC6AD|nr:protein regulator of cytokinesis 1-like isoform X2 [Belonocnema kinseyi]
MTEYTNGEEIMQIATVESISSTVRSNLKRLYDIWKEMGLSDTTRSAYCQEVHKHITELMCEMVTELEEKKTTLLQGVHHLMELANTLVKELQMDDIPGKNPDYEHLPLIEVQEKLGAQVHELQMIKDRRLKYLKELRSREEVLCKKLGTKPIGLNAEMPSQEELNHFQDYLEIQEREKLRLETLFNDYQRSVKKLMEELDITPSLDFERLVCQNYENFVFTSENMTKLKEMRDDLKLQVEDAKQQAEEKRDELRAIWSYLDEPEIFCEKFIREHQGHSVTTLKALSAEIKRCKDKRSENIGKYVAKVRDDLEELWELCKFSETQKRSFMPFYSKTYTEDLLTLHELEAEKLRKFYKTNKKIFDLLEERETLWEKMKELDQRANDPDRFHNRGGQLLAEEKERTNTTKKLPKIEKQLLHASEEFQADHGEVFTINGVTMYDFLEFSKAEYEKEKENMKIARQAKDKSAKKTPLSTSKRTPIGMSMRVRTPGTAGAKRKLPYDSSPNSTVTKRRNVSGEKNRTAVISSKARRSGRISKKALNLSKSNTPRSGKKLKSKVTGSKVNLSISSYGKFQEHLEERNELRSSMLPDQVLENACERGNMKTPVRTPAKPLRKNLLPVPTSGTPRPASSSRVTPRSPRVMHTPRLAPMPNNTHFIF